MSRYWLILMIFALIFIPSFALADLDIHFLDVGDADAIILQCDNEVLVIDGGERENSQFLYSYLRNTLEIEQIKCVVISHPHDDHIGGIPAVLNACQVEMLFSPVIYYPGEPFETVITTAQKQELPVSVAGFGDEFSIGSAVCRVVSPIQTSTNINDLSIALLIQYGDTRFLFAGDMEKGAEELLLNSWEDIQADVLKVAHHGRDTSSTHMFLRVVNADYYVVSGGEKFADAVRNRLTQSGGQIFSTQEQGTIICHSDGENISFQFVKTDYRKKSENVEEEAVTLYYVGNKKSRKLHCSWCSGVATMAERNKVIFETKQEAFDIGYEGCGTCNP